jgi:transposase-like protein
MLVVLRAGRRRRSSVAERDRWIRAWEAGDQTQQEFARANGLSVSTLRGWIRRARRPAPAAVAFREINLAEALGAEWTARRPDWEFEVRLPRGLAIGVARGTAVSRVRELVEALRC